MSQQELTATIQSDAGSGNIAFGVTQLMIQHSTIRLLLELLL